MEPNNSINEVSEAPVSLKEAYPMPRFSIRDAVMAQIAEERAAETKKAESKVLTFREKLAKNRKTIARYGSIAACGVFILGALAVAGPMMNKTSDSAEQLRFVTENEVMEAAVEAENEEVCYSLADTVSDDADRSGEMKLFATGPAMEAGTEAPVEAAGTPVTEVTTTAETVKSDAYYAYSASPTEEEDTAAFIKGMIASQISLDAYSEWLQTNYFIGTSDFSLLDMVKAFAIDEEALEALLGSYADRVNMAVLYGSDIAEAMQNGESDAALDAMVIIE